MIDGPFVAVTAFSLSLATIVAAITWRVIRLDRRQAATPAISPGAVQQERQ